MKRFEYSHEKNALIKKQHGISFEEVIDALEADQLLAAFPSRKFAKKYLKQRKEKI
ncbi:MAG: hypothetical protein AABZ06_04745 [Bdellovibrionota bacterium]